jgi:hypothetical protein
VKQSFYKTARWREVSKVILAYYGRTCMCCHANEAEKPLEVRLIVPRARAPRLEYAWSNMQVLCGLCADETKDLVVDFRIYVPSERRRITIQKLALAEIMARKQIPPHQMKRITPLLRNAVDAIYVAVMDQARTGSVD